MKFTLHILQYSQHISYIHEISTHTCYPLKPGYLCSTGTRVRSYMYELKFHVCAFIHVSYIHVSYIMWPHIHDLYTMHTINRTHIHDVCVCVCTTRAHMRRTSSPTHKEIPWFSKFQWHSFHSPHHALSKQRVVRLTCKIFHHVYICQS